MRYARRVIDGETVIMRVPDPDEKPVAADPDAGIEAANPPGSYELLLWMLTGRGRAEVEERPLPWQNTGP